MGADAATLLVKNMGSCGVAYMNQINSGYTFSVCRKNCAIGYYSFGHEVGHNMGLAHNPEDSDNKVYPYGHGHLIEKGSSSEGFRTIMAYTAINHETRVNFYSNPDVIYSKTGTLSGKEGISNNAAVLVKNTLKMASIGDESYRCKADGTTSSETEEPRVCLGSGCENLLGTCFEGQCIFPFKFKEHSLNSCTTVDGDDQAWCATTVAKNGSMLTWGYCKGPCPGIGYPDCWKANSIPIVKVVKLIK